MAMRFLVNPVLVVLALPVEHGPIVRTHSMR